MGADITHGRTILPGVASGRVVASDEALSFWGGVDPATGSVIDTHHPLCGVSLTDSILVMPGSRGSCSGSGVLLDMALSGRAPSALVFSAEEDVLTLGALVADVMFGKPVPVIRLQPEALQRLSRSTSARIDNGVLAGDGFSIPLAAPAGQGLRLTQADKGILSGAHGKAARQAMQIICAMAVQQGASQLVDVTRVHIDGCIYASPANLTFAERMADAGASVCIPTTTNAISVDYDNWKAQGVSPTFGLPAARLADAYVRMGCQPSFTCSPYLLENPPATGEHIAWAESNAVIFANSVLGARTAKHPDFLDLCIALTGRAPLAGPYLDANRKAQRAINIELPAGADASVWPLIGYLAGLAAPDRIPLLRGLHGTSPSRDDLKALCAAFGTTSGAPMLHIEGVTPEAGNCLASTADTVEITRTELARMWSTLNDGPAAIDLVALGSPHASIEECRAIADAFTRVRRHPDVAVIVTTGRNVLAQARAEGLLDRLKGAGVQVVSDICWCSISEPVFPPTARTVLTNSGKYAHYGPGLSGRAIRFGSLADCVEAAATGTVHPRLPPWLR